MYYGPGKFLLLNSCYSSNIILNIIISKTVTAAYKSCNSVYNLGLIILVDVT